MKNLYLENEANRCLLCKSPLCRKNCPIDTPIPEVIKLFKEDKILEAGEILFKNNPMSVVCAMVCPHSDQCKGNCIRGIKSEPISFHDIEEYISRYYIQNTKFENNINKDEMVAVVGGGPAGITIALILAERGYKVTIFDAHERIGGVLRYGIPSYRLPKDIIDSYEDRLLELGVKIRPNTLIGPVITIDKLFEDGYKAIFIGTGVWNPRTLEVKGESLGNVHYAIDYLKSPNVYRLGKKVCVIGAGDVAMDAARSAKRNGAEEVYILYRKGMDDMPATKEELEGAIKDGIKFELFKAPVEFKENGVVYKETENFVEEDGRIKTIILEDAEGFFECDSIIIAVSQNPRNNIVNNTSGLEVNKWGLLITDEKGNTTRKGVYASGDVVTGAKTVVKAVAHAKEVAEEMIKYLSEQA